MIDSDSVSQPEEGFEEAKKLEAELEGIEREPNRAAAKAVEIVKDVETELGPAACARLVESNVVLTLAGERGQTEFYIEPGEAEVIGKMAPVMAKKGIRIFIPQGEYSGRQMVNVDSLEGYAKNSRESQIPGVTPFDPETGWDGLDNWIRKTHDDMARAQAEGKISKQVDIMHAYIGVVKGYPDRAIIGTLEIPDTPESEKLTRLTDITHAGEYQSAQPNFRFLETDREDDTIKETTRRWGEVLTEFYGSEFHQALSKNEDFKKARQHLI